MVVKLKVEKAQLVLLLSSSKAICSTIHSQSFDLMWLLSLAQQYRLISTIMVGLILSIGGKGEKGRQRSRGSSSCWISYERLIKLSLYERNWNSSLHGLCQWGCDSCHCYWASWYWIRAWAVFFLIVFRISAVLPHLGDCKFLHLPLLWTWIDIRKNTRTEQVFCPRRLNESRWSEW